MSAAGARLGTVTTMEITNENVRLRERARAVKQWALTGLILTDLPDAGDADADTAEAAETAMENARLHQLINTLTPLALVALNAAGDQVSADDAQLRDQLTAHQSHLPQLVGDLISAVSEDAWCAGWLTDCEYALWARVEQYHRHDRCSHWGMSDSDDTTRAVARLSDAALATGTWARWTADGGAAAVPLDEWLAGPWANADAVYRDLAASAPSCGEYGQAATGSHGWPVLPRCTAPYWHAGDHEFDRDDTA